jgi:hypothetical protein
MKYSKGNYSEMFFKEVVGSAHLHADFLWTLEAVSMFSRSQRPDYHPQA